MSDFSNFRKSLDKKFGKDTDNNAKLRSLTADPIIIDAISTGSAQIDRFTGIGGFPRGYITEIFGAPGAGKTTLAYSAIKSAQEQGMRTAYVDVEHSFNPRWAVQQGVDISDDRLIFAQPEIGETAIDLVEELVRNAEDFNIGIIVVDSVSALVPRKQLAAITVENDFIATTASLMKKALLRLKAPVSESKVSLVFINHMKHAVGVVYGDPRTRPGGRDLDFYCSLMLEVRKGDKIEEGGESIATTIKVAGYKNKFAPFSKSTVPEVRVYLHGGVNQAYELLQTAIDLGIVKKSGAWLKYNDENIGQGLDKTTKRLESDSELFNRLESDVAAVPAN